MPLKRREQSVYHNYKYPSPNEVYYRTYRRRNESSLDGNQRRAAADKLQEKAKRVLQQLNPFNRKLKSSVRGYSRAGRSQAGPSHAGRSQTTDMRGRGRSHPATSRHGNVFRRDDHRPISSERFLSQVAMRAETTMPKMKQRKVTCYCCYCLGLSVAPPDHCKKNRLSRPTITFTSDSASFDNFRGRTDWVRNYGRQASPEKKRGRRSYSCHHCNMDYGQAARDFVRDRYNIDLGPKQRVKKYTRGSWSSLKSNRHSSNRYSSKRYPTDWRSKRRTECTSDDSIECTEDGEMESVYSRSTKTSCRTETEKDQSRPTSHEYGSSQSKSEDSQDTSDTKPTVSEGQTTNEATTENDTDRREKGKNANSSKSIKDKRKTKEKKGNETKRVIPVDSVKILKEKMNESTEDDNHSNEIRSVFLGSQAILNESQVAVDEEKSNTETTENESIPEKVEKKAKGSKGKAAGNEKAKKSNKENQTKSSKEKDRKISKGKTKNSKEKNTKKHSKEKKQKKSSEREKPTKKSKEKNKTNEESKKSKKTSETTNKNRRTIVRIVKTESKPNPVPETKSSLKENPSTRPSSKEKLTTRLSSKEKPTNTIDQMEGKKNKTTRTRKRIVENPTDINVDSQMADLIFLMKDCKEKNKLLNLKIAARPASLEF